LRQFIPSDAPSTPPAAALWMNFGGVEGGCHLPFQGKICDSELTYLLNVDTA